MELPSKSMMGPESPLKNSASVTLTQSTEMSGDVEPNAAASGRARLDRAGVAPMSQGRGTSGRTRAILVLGSEGILDCSSILCAPSEPQVIIIHLIGPKFLIRILN